jgi:RNA polymerase sigma-70 factor (ECF subfamily)
MDTCRSQDEISAEFLAAATDEVLVTAAKLGNRLAFAELWERHSNRAFKIAYRITRNREDAEDVIQDTWTKAYVHLESFDGKARFSTWLTRIAINTALMTLRRKRVRPETSTEFTDGETWHQSEIADQTKDVEQQYLRHESLEHLRRAVCALRPTLRHVVEIQLNDTSVEQVAKLAGISIPATKSRLSRAKGILRGVLDPEKNGVVLRRSTQ